MSSSSIKLNIKPQDRPSFWITAESTDTVMQLKQDIATEIDSSHTTYEPSAGTMELIFNGTKLGNNKTLQHYDLVNGDTLILIIKGGSSSD